MARRKIFRLSFDGGTNTICTHNHTRAHSAVRSARRCAVAFEQFTGEQRQRMQLVASNDNGKTWRELTENERILGR